MDIAWYFFWFVRRFGDLKVVKTVVVGVVVVVVGCQLRIGDLRATMMEL